MPTAFLSPFINDTNQYIQIHKSLISAAGYKLSPLSFKTIFSKEFPALFERQNLLIFHWIETRPFYWTKATPKYSLKGILEWIVYYMIATLTKAQVVYFMHDHAVHDTSGLMRSISRRIILAFACRASIRVVHDPSFCEEYKAIYLPHPLYWDTGQPKNPIPAQKQGTRDSNSLKCGILGAIRPYKNIDKVLKYWPKEHYLTIQGRAQKDYAQELETLISDQHLTNRVQLVSRFLSIEAFGEALDKIDVLILPHQAESMLVSGSFFEGIGRVPFILARSTPFVEWASSKTSTVIPFKDDQDIPEALNKIRNLMLNSSNTAKDFALQEFGWERCKAMYSSALTVNYN